MARKSTSERGPGRGEQDIEDLKRRYKAMEKARITAQADLKHAEEGLEKLRKQAREKFGSSDVSELRRKLELMEAENERKRAEYERHLDEIEAKLEEIEQSDASLAARGGEGE